MAIVGMRRRNYNAGLFSAAIAGYARLGTEPERPRIAHRRSRRRRQGPPYAFPELSCGHPVLERLAPADEENGDLGAEARLQLGTLADVYTPNHEGELRPEIFDDGQHLLAQVAACSLVHDDLDRCPC
jgi:hypothetical protein